jgi:2-C-methyl-D-erythritol 4-phosphate cytidylyltransferase
LYDRVVQAVANGADGAVPALPVSDTVKRVDGDHVVETVPREGLVGVQTPQAFRADVLRAVHRAGGVDTDDAALVEAGGGTVVIVEGERRNLKLTIAEDLAYAQAVLGVNASIRIVTTEGGEA